jgi:signal transduction histidine kinase
VRDLEHGPIQFIRGSVFLKLFLIYLGTTLALVLAVGGYNRLVLHNEHFKQTKSKMMAHHLAVMIEEIGHPPDRERAIRLSGELGLQIRVEGPEGMWATETGLPATSALRVHPSQADPDMQMGKYRGRRVAIMARGATHYLFFFPEPPELDLESVGLLIGLIAVILAGSYALVRWLFRPLDWLARGVGEIAKGNLNSQVRRRSRDELGQLTDALNDMVCRVRDMLRARDRLLVDVSHELRSPLTRIKVALEFVYDERAKEKIQQEIRELEAMITELLESERLNSDYGAVVLTDADVIALVREVMELYRDQQPGVRLVSAPASLMLKLDAHRARMALRNVLDNAMTHTDASQGPIEVRVDRREGTVRISVSDHGPGIPIDEQGLIFEPFYRVDKSRTRTTGGYGLGLSLSKKIMMAHGGDLLVTSDHGFGSIFIFTFPTTEPALQR